MAGFSLSPESSEERGMLPSFVRPVQLDNWRTWNPTDDQPMSQNRGRELSERAADYI